jgi:folate-binding protein YgfZ
VVSTFGSAAEVRQRLEDFIIADDVTVEDVTSEWSGVSLLGAGVGAWLAVEQRVGRVFVGRRIRGENWEWIFPSAELAAIQAQLAGAVEIDAAELERRRIVAGVPAVPVDIGLGDLPAEGGLDVEAISYTKGCYLGQEVMARLKSMGQVRRRLIRVRGSGPVPALPAKLTQAGRSAGELRSMAHDAAGFVGMAMVSLLNLQLDQPLAFEASPSSSVEIFPIAP